VSMSIVAALFVSACERLVVSSISLLRTLSLLLVNTSLSGTLFF